MPHALDIDSDQSLALASQAGDPSAFETLARRYQVPLVRFARRIVLDHDLAQDVAQETLIKLYQNRRSYRPPASYRTWAFTIARRTAIDHLRRRRVRTTVALTDQATEHDSPSIDEPSPLWDLARRTLTQEQTQALWLLCVEDLSPRQIAQVIGRSYVATRMVLSRARRKLAAALEAHPQLRGER